MIRLSNGHEFEFMVASGALAFDGKGWLWERPLVWLGIIKPELFTVVIKTLTRHPHKGNLSWWKPWECVRLIEGGSVNKIGLTNPGIEYWCRKIGPKINFEKYPLVGSIFGEKEELVEMAKMFNAFDFKAVEVNVSCPNADHDNQTKTIIESVKAVKDVSRHPIIVKVSYDQDYTRINRELRNTAEAVSINSVKWEIVYPNKTSPLSKLEKRVGNGGGGVSGRPAQPFNWEMIWNLIYENNLPVIGPSVMNIKDVIILQSFEVPAVSFGAIHLRTPWKPTLIVQTLRSLKMQKPLRT